MEWNAVVLLATQGSGVSEMVVISFVYIGHSTRIKHLSFYNAGDDENTWCTVN